MLTLGIVIYAIVAALVLFIRDHDYELLIHPKVDSALLAVGWPVLFVVGLCAVVIAISTAAFKKLG